MGNSVSSINNNSAVKSGLCPHGMSPGACPICSGMGGGGRIGERPQKAGEMSYHECAMIGAMMKARDAQQKLHEQTLAHRAESLKTFEQNLINMAQKMTEWSANIQKSLLLKPVAVIINNIVVPILKSIANIAGILSDIGEKFAKVKEKLIDIQDKLNAVFGEAKAFIDKKISEFVSVLKNKFNNLFKVFKRNKTRDDETKIDEEKKIFRLKTFIQKIFNNSKNQENADKTS